VVIAMVTTQKRRRSSKRITTSAPRGSAYARRSAPRRR
jgi:hypothetical protein